MKTLKSKKELNKMALASGASVADESGARFNTAKKIASPVKRLEKASAVKEVEQTPETPPPISDSGSMAIAQAIEGAAKTTSQMISDLGKQMGEIQMQAYEPITEWEFDFIRDSNGYLVKLLAHGSAPTKTIN